MLSLLSPGSLIAALVAVGLLLGSYFSGRSDGKSICIAAQAQEHAALVTAWRTEVIRQQALADDLATRLAAAEQTRTTVYKEIVREIPAATQGKACLGPAALGLLDRFSAATAGVPQATGQSAGEGGAVTSDTQIAGWALDALEQHERERARCNALIDWHGQ